MEEYYNLYEDNEENNNPLKGEENTSRNNETYQTNNLIVEKNNSMHISIESKSTQTKDISDLNINPKKRVLFIRDINMYLIIIIEIIQID